MPHPWIVGVVQVRMAEDAIDLVSSNEKLAEVVYSEFGLCCTPSFRHPDPVAGATFELQLPLDFERTGGRVSGRVWSFEDYRYLRFFGASLFPEEPALSFIPVTSLQRAHNAEYWGNIVDVMSKSDSLEIDDVTARSFAICEKRMTLQEYSKFRSENR